MPPPLPDFSNLAAVTRWARGRRSGDLVYALRALRALPPSQGASAINAESRLLGFLFDPTYGNPDAGWLEGLIRATSQGLEKNLRVDCEDDFRAFVHEYLRTVIQERPRDADAMVDQFRRRARSRVLDARRRFLAEHGRDKREVSGVDVDQQPAAEDLALQVIGGLHAAGLRRILEDATVHLNHPDALAVTLEWSDGVPVTGANGIAARYGMSAAAVYRWRDRVFAAVAADPEAQKFFAAHRLAGPSESQSAGPDAPQENP